MKNTFKVIGTITLFVLTALFLAACPEEIPVTSVTLNKSTTTLAIGGTETLRATIEPSDATNQGVKWSSTDETKVTVTQRGVITGKAEGSAVIYVTTDDGNKTAICTVTVSPTSTTVPVTSVTLNKSTLSLEVGKTETLIATIAPTNASNPTVSWNSSNTTVAQVTQSGAVSASSVGSTTITVSTADGNKTATCTVTVGPAPIPVSSVSLNKPSTTIVLGGYETLTATVLPVNASNKEVNWTSSDTAVATVSGGIILSVKAGKTTITARTVDGNKSATCEVTVSATSEPVTSVTLNKTSTIILAGGKETLVPIFTPANATNQNVSWRSGNTAVATVSESGEVTGMAAGTATITVTTADGGITATCTVTVSASAVAVSSVSLNKSAASINAGSSERLIATITPSTATNQNLTWESSNTPVASVTASGEVTAVAAGTATITVTTADGNKTATCTVTVSASVPVSGVTLNKTALSLTTASSETLYASITPATATNQAVSWESGNPAVASVSESGLVRGVSAGTTTIKVITADGGKTDTCTVTVTTALTISVSILGTPQIGGGDGLTADVQKNFPGEVSYQWYRGATAIEDGSYQKYYPGPEDGGKAIKVKATCEGKSAESTPVNVPNPAYTVTLSIWGVELYASIHIGIYNYSISENFACQWYRDNVAISGATQSNYTLTSADAGKAIKIKVTGNGQTVESEPYNVPAAPTPSVEFVNASSRPDEDVEDIMQEVREAYENNLNDCKTAIDDIGKRCEIALLDDLEQSKVINGKLYIAFNLEWYETITAGDISDRLWAIGTKLKNLADNTIFASKSGNTGNFEDTRMAKLRLPSNAVATAAVISVQI